MSPGLNIKTLNLQTLTHVLNSKHMNSSTDVCGTTQAYRVLYEPVFYYFVVSSFIMFAKYSCLLVNCGEVWIQTL